MLKFDSKGLLTPNTKIVASVAELKIHFVDAIPSATRPKIFDSYIKYSDALKNLLQGQPLQQWINGSFVTQIPNPKDIDMITFIDYQVVAKLGTQLDNFCVKGSFKVYGVDAYILEVYSESHEKHFFYKSDVSYWMDRFDKTRRDLSGKKNPKGFLEIIY
ncbi:MAG: hypothetical protein H0V01_11960 [Bacteroidetes bacterium]|nr:hypothetical protein [Bacteroidota bacterium]HET6245203.1 hypothetical protein [Bacteroidia bacterium]